MDLAALKTVTLVAKHRSFAATARVLDVDPSSVSRTVANVEEEIGVRLFQRSTRLLSETEEGAAYISQIQPLLEEFDRAQDLARNASNGPSGTLKLTASVSFTQTCIIPHLAEFREHYPDVTLELLASDATLDLIAENIDLAVRLAPAPEGDLISTKLMTTRYVVCASPDYLASHPPINEPRDLQMHECICFSLPHFRTMWMFRQSTGARIEVPVSGRIVISNALSLRSATLNGLGPALMPDWLVEADFQAGTLVNVLPQYTAAASSFETAAWALYPSRSYLPQKVRVMLDFLREKLS